MQRLYPIIFDRNIERVWQIESSPAFTGVQTRRPVYVTERTVVALGAQQRGIGRRLFHEYTGTDTITPCYWNGESLGGKRVAYMHDGLLGDECIHTSVYAQLRRDHSCMDMHVFPERSASMNHHLASYNRDIGGRGRNRGLWFTQEQIEEFDYWITPINVGHEYRGRSEKTQYELLEDELGIGIGVKVPYLYLAEIERQAVRSLVEGGTVRSMGKEAGGRILSLIEAGKVVVFQLNASEECRTPAAKKWADVATTLRQWVPDLVFMVCGDETQVQRFRRFGGDRIEGVVYESSAALTDRMHLTAYGLLYFLERARLVLCPDSFFLHAAAAYDCPTLALWQDDEEMIEINRVPSATSRVKHYEHCATLGMSTETEEIVGRALSMLR